MSVVCFSGYTGVWEQHKLSDVASITMGQSPDGSTYSTTPQGHILIQGNADLSHGWVSPRVWTTQVTKTCDAGDIIMSVRAPAGAIGRTQYNAVIGRGVAAIKGNDFIYQSLARMDDTGYWRSLVTGSTFESINSTDLKNAELCVPSLPEQQKIGSFFHHVDDLINLHQRQTEQLKKLKQGLLQNMFPREGESVPRLRFPGFTTTWEQKEMQDICHYSKTHSEGNRFIGVEDLHQEFAGVNFDKNRRGNGITYQQGDTLMSNIRPYLKKTWLADCDGVCSSDVLVFSPDTVAPDYLHRIISSEHFVSSVMSAAKGSKMPRGDKYQMMKMKVMIPSLSEQKQIGSFFRTLDDLLALHEQYTVKLTQLKKGLLQKMFPQD